LSPQPRLGDEKVVSRLEKASMSTVGEIKATRRMSLADCFAAALAKHERAEIYTGDPEFRAVEKEIKATWI